MISVTRLLTVRNLLIFLALIVVEIFLLYRREPREINNVYIQDLVEIEGDFHGYYARTTQWLNQINANIVKVEPNSIIAEHVDKIASDDGHNFIWHKKITINFKQKEDKYFINVEIIPTSNYREGVEEPYIHWRNLVVEYFEFVGIFLNKEQMMSIFSEDDMRFFLNDSLKKRNYGFIAMIGLLLLSIFFLYREMLRWYVLFIIGFLIMGLVTGGAHTSYLYVKQKCKSLGIK